MKRNLHDLLRFLRHMFHRFAEDRCAQIAASLTFTTLLSVVPLITIALTLFSAFPVFNEFSEHIKEFMLAYVMPETGGKMITQYVEQFAESASRLTAVGVIFLALTALLMINTIVTAFNTIWRVARPRPLVHRILVYWSILTLGPLLVGGSLSLTSWLTGISTGHAHQVSSLGIAGLRIMPIVLTTLAFTLMYKVVPNRFVPMRHALSGGIFASLAFEFMNRAFASYIAHFPAYKLVYGAFASFPIFLLWIYLSWMVILFGALIAASLSHWRSETVRRPEPVLQLYLALRILRFLHEGMNSGTVQTLPLLSKRLRIGFDVLEKILEKLTQAGMVGKLEGAGWAMVLAPDQIRLDTLYRLFVFDPATFSGRSYAPDMYDSIVRIEQQALSNANMTLDKLFSLKVDTVNE